MARSAAAACGWSSRRRSPRSRRSASRSSGCSVLIDIVSPPERWRALGDGFRVSVRIVTLALDEGRQGPGQRGVSLAAARRRRRHRTAGWRCSSSRAGAPGSFRSRRRAQRRGGLAAERTRARRHGHRLSAADGPGRRPGQSAQGVSGARGALALLSLHSAGRCLASVEVATSSISGRSSARTIFRICASPSL